MSGRRGQRGRKYGKAANSDTCSNIRDTLGYVGHQSASFDHDFGVGQVRVVVPEYIRQA